jgi:2-phosphosulfolactate phosphatase
VTDVILVPTAAALSGGGGRRVAVIDVLRATTVVLTALEKGASRVIPVAEVEEARGLRSRLPGVLLAGERGGFAPEGFDYGNSPVELAEVELAGRTVVLTTTNGTLAVRRADGAALIAAACVRNAAAVAGLLASADGPVTLACAGTEGEFTIEDFYCAGLIARVLADRGRSLSDLAWSAAFLTDRPVAEAVNRGTCSHVRTLERRGLGRDVPYCLACNVSDRVPLYVPGGNGAFVLADRAS